MEAGILCFPFIPPSADVCDLLGISTQVSIKLVMEL